MCHLLLALFACLWSRARWGGDGGGGANICKVKRTLFALWQSSQSYRSSLGLKIVLSCEKKDFFFCFLGLFTNKNATLWHSSFYSVWFISFHNGRPISVSLYASYVVQVFVLLYWPRPLHYSDQSQHNDVIILQKATNMFHRFCWKERHKHKHLKHKHLNGLWLFIIKYRLILV